MPIDRAPRSASPGAESRAVQAKPGVPSVRAVERAVALLKAFGIDRPHLTLTELAQRAELDKGTARRLLHTLLGTGLVAFDPNAQLYRLGADLVELASAVPLSDDLREVAAPIIAEVAEKTGSSAFLWVSHDDGAICVDRVRTRMLHIDATWFRVGARSPLNCGAGPRVVLAHVSDQVRERVLAGPLPQRTAYSETSAGKLREAAAIIRDRGWELAVNDFFVGLAAVGVPIFDRAGNFAGALSITSLTDHLVENGNARYLDILREAAHQIGVLLKPAPAVPGRLP